jgi:hypothetical protein
VPTTAAQDIGKFAVLVMEHMQLQQNPGQLIADTIIAKLAA